MDGVAEGFALMKILTEIVAALLPALIYLAALLVMDSYKLVRPRQVVQALAFGAVAVVVCRWMNGWLLTLSGLQPTVFVRYVAPLVEEAAKAVYLVLLLRRGRMGFAIDAAVLGFAVGTGFGVAENAFFLVERVDTPLVTWILRGCGTALMHGSTAAVFAIIARSLQERRARCSLVDLIPGFGLAWCMHAAYNHFLVSPALAAVGLVLGVPLITITVFRFSERALERWLGHGFDTDAELLRSLHTGTFDQTHVGRYLTALRDRFPALVVADMFCLLQLEVELSIHAKGLLMLRKRGYDAEPAADVPDKLREIAYLERSLGATGRLAIQALRKRGRRDQWETHLLSRAAS
jgi:RsiW-degrading membrane proteinase PrsW (M82 family)